MEREILGFRLASAYRRVDRLLARALRDTGLAPAHAHVLACLLEGEELRLVQLARRTGFDPSTVSRLVKELKRRRFVKFRPDPEDARAQLLRPGARAERLRDDLAALLRKADARLRRGLPDADIAGLLNATDILDRLP